MVSGEPGRLAILNADKRLAPIGEGAWPLHYAGELALVIGRDERDSDALVAILRGEMLSVLKSDLDPI
jgi:hypothetical protein